MTTEERAQAHLLLQLEKERKNLVLSVATAPDKATRDRLGTRLTEVEKELEVRA